MKLTREQHYKFTNQVPTTGHTPWRDLRKHGGVELRAYIVSDKRQPFEMPTFKLRKF